MDTGSWSATAVGVHLRLMNYSWINGPLPEDTEALARITRLDHGNFKKVWYRYVTPKWTKTDEGFVNPRLEYERQKRRQYLDNQRDRAIKRWGNKDATALPRHMPEDMPEPCLSFSSSKRDNIVVSGANNNCPHQEIIALYHEILPALSRVRQWTPKRQKLLKARWFSSPEYQSLQWWKAFFEYIRECPHLIGKNDRQWTADLEWLCVESNFVKTLEGRYDNR